MNMDIRSHIINNFKGDDINTLKDAINESIKNNDENTTAILDITDIADLRIWSPNAYRSSAGRSRTSL